MSRFLVQVNKDGGYANIQNNGLYENHLWAEKPRDVDHGQVKAGDELIIYCTSNVRVHGQSIAFAVGVERVSPDHVKFELGTPRWFTSPLKLANIRTLVSQHRLSEVFGKCGQQGFNIAHIDPTAVDQLMSLVGADFRPNSTADTETFAPVTPATIEREEYKCEHIIEDGCFLDHPTLEAMLQRLQAKQNLILQGPPGTGKTWAGQKAGLRPHRA